MHFIVELCINVSVFRSSSKIILEMVLWDGFHSCHNVALDIVEIEFFSKRIFSWLFVLEKLSYLLSSSIDNNNKFLLFLKIKEILKIRHINHIFISLFQSSFPKFWNNGEDVDELLFFKRENSFLGIHI